MKPIYLRAGFEVHASPTLHLPFPTGLQLTLHPVSTAGHCSGWYRALQEECGTWRICDLRHMSWQLGVLPRPPQADKLRDMLLQQYRTALHFTTSARIADQDYWMPRSSAA